jgi:hypothetical protein
MTCPLRRCASLAPPPPLAGEEMAIAESYYVLGISSLVICAETVPQFTCAQSLSGTR